MGSARFFQLWPLPLHPTVNCWVINLQAPLVHHLCYLPVAEWVGAIPAHIEDIIVSLQALRLPRHKHLSISTVGQQPVAQTKLLSESGLDNSILESGLL